jgi:hypothetical protein
VAQRGFAANRRADGRVLPSAGRPGVWVACGIPVFENSVEADSKTVCPTVGEIIAARKETKI